MILKFMILKLILVLSKDKNIIDEIQKTDRRILILLLLGTTSKILGHIDF